MTEKPTERPLTKKQRTILEAILFLIRRGEIPTVREVGSLVGLRSPATVLKHLRVLEKACLISLSGKSRGIRIADPDLLRRMIESTAGAAADSEGEVSSPEAAGPPSGPLAGPLAGPLERGEQVTGSRFSRLQAHLPGVIRLAALSTDGRGGASRFSRGIPLVGAIAAGHPFESYSEGYLRDEVSYGDCHEFRYDELSSSEFTDGFSDGFSGRRGASSTSTVPGDSPMLEIDPRAFCDSGDVLALRVEGDSMINAGILDGDYAIIRRQSTVEEGDIAAVIINGEGTLKRWTTRRDSDPNRGSSISLKPENDNFDPIEISEEQGKDVLVIGKYVGLIRGIQPLV